jgi:hypothetical protein
VGAKRLEITLGRCKRPPQVLCSHGVWCTSLLSYVWQAPTDLTLFSRVDLLTSAAIYTPVSTLRTVYHIRHIRVASWDVHPPAIVIHAT